MRKCTRKLEFDAAHRVLRHESKCSTLHGHRYVVEVTCEAEHLDDVGRVVDFGVIKAVFGKWIDDHLDHTTIVNRNDTNLMGWCTQDSLDRGKRMPYILNGEPTAENLAKHLLEKAQDMIGSQELRVSKVRVWETPNCFAEYEAPR